MADPKAKDAPKKATLDPRFEPTPAEVQSADVKGNSTLYSDRGDKPPPVTDAKPGAKAAPKSVSDLAYGAPEPAGAVAARTALTRENGGAESVAAILRDHPRDREAILREAEQLRGAGFAADVKRAEQKAAEKPAGDHLLTEPAPAAETKKQDERGAEVQTGEAKGEKQEASPEAGVVQVTAPDTHMTE